MTTPSPAFRIGRLDGPGALLAAIPGLLGFVPSDSFVVLGLHPDDHGLGPIMRADLYDEPADLSDESATRRRAASGAPPGPAEQAALFAMSAALARVGCEEAVLVVVGGPLGDVGRLRDRVAAGLDVDVVATVWAATLVEGARWAWPERGLAGRLPDPALSPTALARAVGGRPVAASRKALRDRLAPAGCPAERSGGRCGCPDADMDPLHAPQTPRARLEAVADAFAEHVAGRDPTCRVVATVGTALLDRVVRDVLIATSLDAEGRAAGFWESIARRAAGESRAAAATLLAYCEYVRGGGAAAMTALEVAMEVEPDYSLARIVAEAVVRGLPPEDVKAVANGMVGYALRQGVDDVLGRMLSS